MSLNYTVVFSEVKHIRISQNFVDDASLGSITSTIHGGDTVYKTNLEFSHSLDGIYKLCFVATDKNGYG